MIMSLISIKDGANRVLLSMDEALDTREKRVEAVDWLV